MYETISDFNRNKQLQKKFKDKFRIVANQKVRSLMGFQGGSFTNAAYYSKELEVWMANTIGVDGNGEDNRYWNAFGTSYPEKDKNASIVCEINIPLEGINRRIAAGFAENESGDVVLFHRGKIGGGRKGIGKQLFLDNYRGVLEEIVDGDQINEVAIIGNLDSVELAYQIAIFVEEIERIKNLVSVKESLPDFDYAFNEEFVGSKIMSPRAATEAKCNHGRVVKQLAVELEELGYNVANDRNKDLFIYEESGAISAIFEIKPDTSNSSIYSGIGQLVIYSIGTKAKQVLVIPDELDKKVKKKLKKVGIEVLVFEWIGEEVRFKKLKNFIQK